MSKVLCVAEKPSIAKAIARALGGGKFKSSASSSKFIWNYEFAYNSPVWGPCEMIVTSVLGHMTDIKFAPPFDDFNSDAVQLFSAPIITYTHGDSQKVAQNITKQSKKVNILFIWTDCDREGEHIGGEIAEVAAKANRRVEIYRAEFNNTEASHLKEAARSPRRLDRHQIEAVSVRRELDLRTGFSMTRLQTQLYRKAFGRDFASRAVQYGSCQFPTLGFVVERYLRHKNHVPEPFWYIDASAKNKEPDGKPVGLSWTRQRVFDRMVGVCFYERCLNRGDGFFEVTSVKKTPASRKKPLPLTTVTFQQKASTALKLSGKKIMQLSEKLYNEGFVSYPRTETDSFDPAIDLKKLVAEQLRPDLPWASHADKLLKLEKFNDPRKGKKNDKAHPPIHPVQAVSREQITDNDMWRVYEFITRSFLASCSEDARGYTTSVTLKYGTEEFTASGTEITHRGFLDVYPYQQWNPTTVPDWKKGDRPECVSINLKDGKTTAPPLLTESELVGLMDANGIGTDATMADHITKIKEALYITKKGQYFSPTPLGIALVLSYDSIGLQDSLTKPFLRKETESLVSEIAAGSKKKLDVLGSLVSKYEKVFRQCQARRTDLMKEAKKHIEAN